MTSLRPAAPARTFSIVVLVASLSVFSVLAEGIEHGRAILQLDHRIQATMTEYAATQPVIVGFFGALTQLGDVAANTAVMLLVGGVLLLRGQGRLALVVLLLGLGVGFLDTGLKLAFGRPRPDTPAAMIHETNPSFPSGHSMASVVCYGLLLYLLLLPVLRRPRAQAAVVTAYVILVLLIGFSRVYLRAHYLSDVLAGLAVGTAWLTLSLALVRLLQQPPRARGASSDILAAGELPLSAVMADQVQPVPTLRPPV
jgi:undecaprenyl-diphosphatase